MSEGFDRPSWYISLLPLAVLIATLEVVVHIFGADSLEGGSQVALLFASGVTIAISMIFYRKPWEEFENAITDNIRSIGTAILILLMIGAVAGTWMVSGVVPTLIYYGMKAITPAIFLLAGCVISALVSMMTGSSWTTIATIGVALIGIGTALGFAPGWTAGAIISGAYFGDKVSPLSDTTILASSSSGTALFTHIRYMLVTTVPSFAIACAVFLIVSICHNTTDNVQAAEFSASLKESFNISPWLFTVPFLTAIFIIKKLPALLTLFLASLLACIAAIIFQPQAIYE
ncbi:MAG: sodium:proton antiporter, partial [Bacteroidales bacterium]|nr:sodium:proton antiporter [Bacteroidales bacterium]